MSNIKFRAYLDTSDYQPWHQDYNKSRMLSWDDLKYGPDLLSCYFNNQVNGVSELMKFINKTDKNSNDIYVNDIITGELIEYDNLIVMGIVEYDFYESCYSLKNDAGLTPLFRIDGVEIIGNIYENPELLKRDD